MRATDLIEGVTIHHPYLHQPVKVVRVTKGLKAVKIYFTFKGGDGRLNRLPNEEVEEVK